MSYPINRQLILMLLVAHSVVSGYVFLDESVWAVFPPFRENYVNQIFSDLVCALGLVSLLIYPEVKRRGGSRWKFGLMMVGIVFLGSFSPMIYLLAEKKLFSGPES
jgi:hypothetical protein